MNRLVTLLLLLLTVAGLIVSLDADPSRLLWRDFITDEGWWTGEARDRALFGEWVMDEYNQGLSTPLATWTWWLSFRALGASLWAARLPGAIASLLALLLLGLLARRPAGDCPGGSVEREPDPRLAALLLGSAIPFAMHARIAMPEPLSLFLVLAAWLCLSLNGYGEERRRSWSLLAGLCFGAALSAKLAVIVAYPALAWMLHYQREEVPEAPLLWRWRPALHFTFASLLVWRLLRLPFELGFPREIASLDLLHRGENLPGALIDALANIAYFPWPAPLLYQVAPLLALAGFGAWQLRFSLRGRGAGAQALSFLLLTTLAQSCLNYPADRRYLILLPALALLAARGAAAVAGGEAPAEGRPSEQGTGLPLWQRAAGAALVLAFVLPGRLALWLSRLLDLFGNPMDDFRTRGLAALLFVAAFTASLFWLLGRPRHIAAAYRTGLLIGWLVICLEPLDLLLVGWLGQLAGRYDASRLWLEAGAWWALPWGLLTLALVWLPLSRGGVLPRIGALERARGWLPYAVPLVALLWLAPTWALPRHTLRDASAILTAPLADGSGCRAVLGAEAPGLAIGSDRQTVPIRDEFNRYWLENAPAGTRIVRLVEDSGYRRADWPAGADTLGICPEPDGRPRFLFAVWEVR